ncbi:unnamed protein product [Prorocentrum cordatum]|uniref:Uncharacterized protein n=1 Tax=Prorocentrum cordatum TaxID=2364126 RepID=A0ABN9V3A9_9DINO|nr:unnamed protein product [Polarella glacialis]
MRWHANSHMSVIPQLAIGIVISTTSYFTLTVREKSARLPQELRKSVDRLEKSMGTQDSLVHQLDEETEKAAELAAKLSSARAREAALAGRLESAVTREKDLVKRLDDLSVQLNMKSGT